MVGPWRALWRISASGGSRGGDIGRCLGNTRCIGYECMESDTLLPLHCRDSLNAKRQSELPSLTLTHHYIIVCLRLTCFHIISSQELKASLNNEFRLIHELCVFVLMNTRKVELIRGTSVILAMPPVPSSPCHVEGCISLPRTLPLAYLSATPHPPLLS